MSTTSPLVFVDVNGQPHTAPSVSSRWTFDITTATRFVSTRDTILMSYMEGGPANALVPFLDLYSLQQTYDPEALGILGADLASYLKTPSYNFDVRGAYRIYVLRLGQPTGAALTLNNAAAQPVLTLTATDLGTYTNKLSVEVASGTIVGKRVTLRFRQETTVLDNLQNALHVGYVGNATAATLTITRAGDRATRLQTTLTGASDGSISLDLDLTQATFGTIQQLAQYVNGQNGYRAALDRYGDPLLPSAELDAVASASVRTPVALTIHYVGSGTAATMSVTNTSLTTTVTGAAGDNLTIDLTAPTTNTLGELVAYIDTLPAYTCQLGPNADADAFTVNLLQAVAGQDIRTATYALNAQPGMMDYVAQAGLGSIVFAINSRVGRVHAARLPGAVTVPANVAQTFFSGGTNPVPTTQDWLTGLNVIEQEALVGALLLPVTTDPVIQDAVNAWSFAMWQTYGKTFRPFLAAPDQTTAAAAKDEALGLNSTFACYLFQPVVAASGVTEQVPLYPVAMYCGAAAGAIPTQPVTRTVLRCRSLPTRAKLSTAVQEDLLNNGVCTLEEVKGVGVRIALAITTSLSSNRIDRMLSESMARDVIDQRIRAYVEPLIPHWAMLNWMPTVNGSVYNALKSLEDDGIISKGIDANGKLLPAWLPVQIQANAGVLTITVCVLIGGELDHINIVGSIGYQQFNLTIAAA